MPRVPRLSIEQRVAIVRLYFCNGKNASLTVSLFRRHYPNYKTLCSSTVLRVVPKFVEHGTVQDRLKTNCGRKKTVQRWHHCSENVADPNSEHVRVFVCVCVCQDVMFQGYSEYFCMGCDNVAEMISYCIVCMGLSKSTLKSEMGL